MRFVVPLLLIIGVALPAAGHAKAGKPSPAKAARVARAVQPATHRNALAAGAWVVPAGAGFMAAAVQGFGAVQTSRDDRSPIGALGAPGAPATSVSAPPVSPE